MPKYIVTLEETVHYDVEVEADNADDALDVAVEVWCNSATPTEDFNGQGRGVEPINVEQQDAAALDGFMRAVANELGRDDVMHDADFQLYCANQFGAVSVPQAAESWQRRA